MLPLKKHTDIPLSISHKRSDTDRQAEVVDYLINHKKNAYKKFKGYVLLFRSLGLLISMALVLLAFEWKSFDRVDEVEVAQADVMTDEILDIPITEQPPPPPKQAVQQPNIIEVTEEEIIEEIEVDFDIEITEDEAIEDVQIDFEIEKPEEEVAEEIFTIVEQKPEPAGGLATFMKYVAENIVYPERALRLGVQGRVFVQFVVNADGSLSDLVVVKGIGSGCDEEAVRVLQEGPAWEPGTQRGNPVRVRMVMPINFVYKQKKSE